jgi:hypothetical protein
MPLSDDSTEAHDVRGVFERAGAGDGPFFSAYLGAYLVGTDAGRRLRVSNAANGKDLWPTGEESERALRVTERDQALTRIAELEAELRRRGA